MTLLFLSWTLSNNNDIYFKRTKTNREIIYDPIVLSNRRVEGVLFAELIVGKKFYKYSAPQKQ